MPVNNMLKYLTPMIIANNGTIKNKQ